jgi:hypothetical protein
VAFAVDVQFDGQRRFTGFPINSGAALHGDISSRLIPERDL